MFEKRCREVQSGCPRTLDDPFQYRPRVDAPPDEADLLAREPAVLTGALIGYARVSTADQILDRQTRALAEVGCLRVFAEKRTGRTAELNDPSSRPVWTTCAPATPWSLSASTGSPAPCRPDHPGRRPAPPRRRLPQHARGAGRHHARWPARLPRLRRPGRVLCYLDTPRRLPPPLGAGRLIQWAPAERSR